MKTVELWPLAAARTLAEKGVQPQDLRRVISHVVFPWNQSYNSYRFLFSLQIAELPLFVIVLEKPEEAVLALDLAAAKRLTLRVLSGRHTSAVQNPDFYVDMTRLQTVRILGPHLVSAQGGATQGQVFKHLFDAGLASSDMEQWDMHNSRHWHFAGAKLHHPLLSLGLHPEQVVALGSAVTVGAAGITTCGGLGPLKRTLGLSVDLVESITLAVPSRGAGARVLVTSPDSHSELFWALRGGLASNFGIVLTIVYRTPYIKRIVTSAFHGQKLRMCYNYGRLLRRHVRQLSMKIYLSFTMSQMATLNRLHLTQKSARSGCASAVFTSFRLTKVPRQQWLPSKPHLLHCWRSVAMLPQDSNLSIRHMQTPLRAWSSAACIDLLVPPASF